MTDPEVTLRDYFAAAALSGLLPTLTMQSEKQLNDAASLCARYCYVFADAMLKERERKKT